MVSLVLLMAVWAPQLVRLSAHLTVGHCGTDRRLFRGRRGVQQSWRHEVDVAEEREVVVQVEVRVDRNRVVHHVDEGLVDLLCPFRHRPRKVYGCLLVGLAGKLLVGARIGFYLHHRLVSDVASIATAVLLLLFLLSMQRSGKDLRRHASEGLLLCWLFDRWGDKNRGGCEAGLRRGRPGQPRQLRGGGGRRVVLKGLRLKERKHVEGSSKASRHVLLLLLLLLQVAVLLLCTLRRRKGRRKDHVYRRAAGRRGRPRLRRHCRGDGLLGRHVRGLRRPTGVVGALLRCHVSRDRLHDFPVTTTEFGMKECPLVVSATDALEPV
jgi:hypothetical protein